MSKPIKINPDRQLRLWSRLQFVLNKAKRKPNLLKNAFDTSSFVQFRMLIVVQKLKPIDERK